MKVFIFGVFLGLLATVWAAPTDKLDEVKPIAIVRSISENNPDGSYSYSFEGEDGTKVDESGNQKRVGPKAEDIGTISSGSYSYLSPDGTPISVVWTSNENGFVATGDHLPTPPPMPQHVVKMLDGHLEK
ncbi:endocuticle structural glycoprotein ABD-4-like [Daphnia pulex]|uniref:Endocuticle structural glycoprotein SgAbd-2 n=1 Tax=Daphnia pulex TaxID=6669 RepID=E9HPM2_DAPPU|nr:endocuticle structural glycoprotein ABD-4-like [Daphnia pulex]XP_046636252.1 endocuticle structural glycoprotein ABD-4-like [Daphnia pulicaria]EFX66317.1 hypothetical protein DAPPUDRAFT_302739 [Daphnia pulex]|eukprot:EFX66317.1 hypothetical protein DAPPUDRAFT_302739 [Daphnia pulex]